MSLALSSEAEEGQRGVALVERLHPYQRLKEYREGPRGAALVERLSILYHEALLYNNIPDSLCTYLKTAITNNRRYKHNWTEHVYFAWKVKVVFWLKHSLDRCLQDCRLPQELGEQVRDKDASIGPKIPN